MIIDASVAFKWIVDEEDSAIAFAWIGREPLAAPTLIHTEVGNALWKRGIRGQLLLDGEAAHHLSSLVQLIETMDETLHLPRALELALELKHPIYDCIYLAIAIARDQQLLTADLRFIEKLVGTPCAERLTPLNE